jgi:tocopherol O-methyltransferase
MFTNDEIAEYYDTTQIHYKRWWNLEKTRSLHYGIWEKGTRSLSESLVNTIRIMMDMAEIKADEKVLDAGCGLGSAAFYVNSHKNAVVLGISLSRKQVDSANETAQKNRVDKVTFQQMDFTKTVFKDDSFDVVWACESVCQANDKEAFVKESFRILREGGRLIISDFFLTKDNQNDKNSWIEKWGDTWAVSNFVSGNSFVKKLETNGFHNINLFDYTDKIQKSARRLYYFSILGAVPSELYNLFNPGVSRFAKSHYKCGFYQYKALKAHLWKYNIISAVK